MQLVLADIAHVSRITGSWPGSAVSREQSLNVQCFVNPQGFLAPQKGQLLPKVVEADIVLLIVVAALVVDLLSRYYFIIIS